LFNSSDSKKTDYIVSCSISGPHLEHVDSMCASCGPDLGRHYVTVWDVTDKKEVPLGTF